MSTLTSAEIESLEAPISEDEDLLAIKSLKPGKSPGPDGFTAHHYRAFTDILKTPFLHALNHLKTPQPIPEAFTMTHIALISKPAKYPTDCASYRPILLLNWDLKILASRLVTFLPKLIGLAKVGFMPGWEARDNVIKALNLIHCAHTREIKGLLLSTSAEKAFDCVGWDYLFTTCKLIGLESHMMSWIAALYHKPQAQPKINGILSKAVHVNNCVRQGCPLSPLLLILSLEPFIRLTNANPDIRGVQLGPNTYKIAAYADDLLFFLPQPHISIPSLTKAFQLFGYISNMKINYIKSEALNLTLSPNSLSMARAKGGNFINYLPRN